jgi:hypothetical protein
MLPSSLIRVMTVAVHFDNQLSICRIKIDDVGADAVLTAKLDAELLTAQRLP